MMINLALFGFLTGFHLALLQFSYFFVLLFNISSTYVTYAAVVISWMTGTLLGLFWGRLNAPLALAAGVVSYYLVYVLVFTDPLELYTFPAAMIGIAVSGLWAGRFFVVMLPVFQRADRIFFHENNGFLVGIVALFLGFTLTGTAFLRWVPLLSGSALLAQMMWIGARHRNPELTIPGIATKSPDPPGRA